MALVGRHLPHRQVACAGDLGFDAAPPDRGARAEAVDADVGGTRRGAHQPLVVGLADVDPVLDLPGQVFLPQAGLVGVPQVLGELERAMVVARRHVEREREEANHHPLVGLRRMARQRDAVIAIDLPVHVGELDAGFVDRGFERHAGPSMRSGD